MAGAALLFSQKGAWQALKGWFLQRPAEEPQQALQVLPGILTRSLELKQRGINCGQSARQTVRWLKFSDHDKKSRFHRQLAGGQRNMEGRGGAVRANDELICCESACECR